MKFLFGFVFLVLSIWQLIMCKQAFKNLKQKGNENTSPFIMLSLWSGVLLAIIFLGIALSCIFGKILSF